LVSSKRFQAVVLKDSNFILVREMLGLSSIILAIALFTLVCTVDASRDGKHQRTSSAELPSVPVMQKQVVNGTALVVLPTHAMLPKLPTLMVTHTGGSSFRQSGVPEVKHKKKPGKGYEQGSPLYDRQQKRKMTEVLLPPPPTGRQRPSLTVIMVFIFLGVIVLVIAACINRDFLVRRLDTSFLDLPKPPPQQYKTDMSQGQRPPPSSSTRYLPSQQLGPPAAEKAYQSDYVEPQVLQPIRAQVEYVDPAKSQRLVSGRDGLNGTLPPNYMQGQSVDRVPPKPVYGEPPVSMMPSQQQQQPYASMPPRSASNSPMGSANLGVYPPPNSASPTQYGFQQQQQLPAPPVYSSPGPLYATVPPQQPGGPGYLPPPRSQQYQSMPPVGM